MLFRIAGRWTQTDALPLVVPPSTSTSHGCVEERKVSQDKAAAENQRQIFSILKTAVPGCLQIRAGGLLSPNASASGHQATCLGELPRIHLVLGRARNGGQRGQKGIHPSLTRKWKLPSQQRGSRGAQSTGWPQLFIWQSPPNPQSSLEMEIPSHIKIGAACLFGRHKAARPYVKLWLVLTQPHTCEELVTFISGLHMRFFLRPSVRPPSPGVAGSEGAWGRRRWGGG